MSSFAQRKLAQLQASSKVWAQRSAELAEEHPTHEDNEVGESQSKKQKTDEATTSRLELVSDATADEEAALAAILGGEAKEINTHAPQPNSNESYSRHVRKVQPTPMGASKVKIEGEMSKPTSKGESTNERVSETGKA